MVDIRLSQDPEPERKAPKKADPEQPQAAEHPPAEPPPAETPPAEPAAPANPVPPVAEGPSVGRRGRGGTRPPASPPPADDRQRRIWWIVAIVGAVIAGLLLASTVWTGQPAQKNEGKTSDINERLIAPEKQCARQSTYDLIRRELFRRAAQIRGGDTTSFEKLSDFALLRIQSPMVRGVDEDLERINCAGTAVLQLPPGVRIADGGSTLSSPIEYALQPSADGTGNVVLLGNVDALTIPLATVGRPGQHQAAPLELPDMDPLSGQGSQPIVEPAQPPTQPQPQSQPAPPAPSAPQPQADEPAQTGSARPSFNCANARTRGERAVCSDSGLAALDRQMSSQFYAAQREANPQQRALLNSTRSGFLAFRDRCRSDSCIADTYRGRIREINDIMAGRWQGRR